MNADQGALLSSLIWVHIVCNIGYLSILADRGADYNCHEHQELTKTYVVP